MKRKLQRLIPICTLGLGIIFTGCEPQQSSLELPQLFTDNMVLQQNSDVAVWGKANPGSEIKINGDWGATATTTATADSSWLVKIATPAAGGPHTLNIRNDDSTLIIQNVLSGEVWLASGQSNMEMPLMGWLPDNPIDNSETEIAAANYPNIRMFSVTRTIGTKPMDDVIGNWAVCSPTTAPNMSATAFFFAKKLHSELNVPIGIINSSWGGTPAESWIEGKILQEDPDFKSIIASLDSIKPQMKAYEEWLKKYPSINIAPKPDSSDPLIGINLFDSICSNPALDHSTWNAINMPGSVENTIGEFDGAIWLRKEIDIPQTWVGKELQLHLGAIDDRDITFFNGQRVGAYEEDGQWQVKREYTVPANLVQKGKAVIAVRVLDTQGGGGITGGAESMTLSPKDNKTSISLAGEWKYKVVGIIKQKNLTLLDPAKDEYANKPKLTLQLGCGTASTLFNAMIAPLVPYNIKGVIWYQGETNVGRANQYARLMTMLINNWRTQFNQPELPFYLTQLAPWNYSDVNGTSSATLREAQRRTMNIPNTGMISTLDIGNNDNIHPSHKKEVGERLALWAMANNYGKTIAFSGPLFKGIEIKDNTAILNFTNCNEGIVIDPQVPNQFEIAGLDKIFYPATTSIEGETIICKSPKVKTPVSVRYAFRNGAQASLRNGAGLPAPSFTTEDNFNDY